MNLTYQCFYGTPLQIVYVDVCRDDGHICFHAKPFTYHMTTTTVSRLGSNVLAFKIISIGLEGDVFLYKSSINEIKHFQSI